MADFQTKLGEGLNKIKGGIEQGKQKLQVAQEVGEYRRKVKENSQEKARILVELGQKTYQLLRQQQLSNHELEKIATPIIELDKGIFSSLKHIHELRKSEETAKCDCGAALQPDAKFCGSCGKSIDSIQATAEVDLVTCEQCDYEMPSNAAYCGCCGKRGVATELGGV